MWRKFPACVFYRTGRLEVYPTIVDRRVRLARNATMMATIKQASDMYTMRIRKGSRSQSKNWGRVRFTAATSGTCQLLFAFVHDLNLELRMFYIL